MRRILHALRHPISQNVVALYGVQLATFVVPLITLPYLSRVLEPSAFGLVLFAQGFAFLMTAVVDWGFSPYATRECATLRNDPSGLSAFVAEVRGAQLLLTLGAAAVTAAATLVVPNLHDHPDFALYAWIAACASALAPGWYFIGVEKMRLASVIQLTGRVIQSALTILLVSSPSGAWIVMALFAGASVLVWLVCDVVMYRQIGLRRPTFGRGLTTIRDAGPLFVATTAASLYTSFNVVLLGLFVPSARVAHFATPERIVRTSMQVLAPVAAAVYPRLNYLQSLGERERAKRLLTIAVAVVGAGGVVLAIGLAVLAGPILRILFGSAYVTEGVPVMRVLVLIIPLQILGAVAGTWLMTLRHDRLVVWIVVRAGILNVALGCVLAPLFGPVGMAWSVVAAELTAALGGAWGIYRVDRGFEVRPLRRPVRVTEP